MRRLILLVISGLIIPMAFALPPTSRPPLSIPIANNHQAVLTLSNQDINRLFVAGDKIIRVNAPSQRLIVHNDPSGSIFIQVLGQTPFTAFLATQSGGHFSLLMVPKSQPGITVQLIPDKLVLPGHYHQAAAKRLEQSSAYEKTLINLLREDMHQHTPAGYTLIAVRAFSDIPIFQVPKYLDEKHTLSAQVIAGALGDQLALRQLRITNESKYPIQLLASDFYQPGVRAIALTQDILLPQHSTIIYEVISNV